jgi:hypothetical protein
MESIDKILNWKVMMKKNYKDLHELYLIGDGRPVA